jgi:hypothetical protein
MIVMQVGIKTECKIYGCRSIKKHQNYVNKWVGTQHSHTKVKLVASCKTTQYF